MRLVVVPHGAKVTGVTEYLPELGADPPMTMAGKAAVLKLVEPLRALGPFNAAFCSLMDRACGTMCTIVKPLGIRQVTCIDELGQYGNLDGSTVIPYPGHEKDDLVTWQQQGVEAVGVIWSQCAVRGTVLAFTHRPILAGLLATAAGVTDSKGIREILDSKELLGNGFRIFSYDRFTLRLEV